MKRRTLLSRALGWLGIGAGAASVKAYANHYWPPVLEGVDVRRDYPWSVLRWVQCQHVDGGGASLVMEIVRVGDRDNMRCIYAGYRTGSNWTEVSHEWAMAVLKVNLLKQLDQINATEIMALYA